MQFVLIRHGETDWNIRGQIQGHLDTKLNSTGKKQAKRILNSLNSLNVSQINKIYSSDSLRAWETAQILNFHFDNSIPLISDSRLRERNYGEWQGLTWDEIRLKYPSLILKWKADPLYAHPPKGESIEEVFLRVKEFWESLKLSSSPSKSNHRICIVSHNSPLRILVLLIHGLPLAEFNNINHIPNAHPIIFDFPPKTEYQRSTNQQNWQKLDHHDKIL